MNEKLKDNPAVKTLVVLILGLLLLNFFFSVVFGTGNITSQFVGLINLVIEVMVLIMVATLFYGFYKILKDNASYILKELGLEATTLACKNCGRKLTPDWNCCPMCGSDK